MSYIPRTIETIVTQLNQEYPALLITGPRQVGKTTMLMKLMEEEGGNRVYVSLDDLAERNLAKSDPAMFFQLHPPPVFIDEVQYAPELFTYIKIHIDKNHKAGDFWLTGSQIFKLMKGVQESLAGRVALLHMSTLSQEEIYPTGFADPFSVDLDRLIKKQAHMSSVSTPEIFQRIFSGGMPALISKQYTDRAIYFSSYISTYLNRDVRDLSGNIDSLKFMNFITATAARAGQLVNYKSIAEDSGIDQVTAKNWMGILETLGMVFFLHPFSNNVLKRTIKTPKLYFYDTGLVCYLTRWSSAETTMNGAMNGALLENYAISEVMKSYQNMGKEPFLYYYRDKDMKEIDLLIEQDGTLNPIEIKKTATPDKRMANAFNIIDKSPLAKGLGAVLCMAEKVGALDSDTLIVPIALI